MFKRGELIDVSMTYDFSNVYDGIFLEYVEGKIKSFLCVSDDTIEDYKKGKEFKTTVYRFARPWTYVKEPIEKEIPKSGLSQKALEAVIGIL